ncbi:MAG: hypothetical protein RL885_01900 [Planctomycetota bacterium]
MPRSTWVAVCLLSLCPWTLAAGDPGNFAGRWQTSLGPLELRQQGSEVSGDYRSGRLRARLHGSVSERRLEFRYVEGGRGGEGYFELSENGEKLTGGWRRSGRERWRPWSGDLETRREIEPPFAGVWKTTWGPLRLTALDGKLSGPYGSAGSRLEGEMKDGRLVFEYTEPTTSGEGWFELAEDGRSFDGRWREKGTSRWRSWRGDRVASDPSRVWLVILEAHWEEGLTESEYDFGSMLRAYFTMSEARQVAVRQRFFHDLADFQRFCREAAYLTEPVVLLVSTHGTPEGISVGGETISPEEIADSVSDVPELLLLHLSGCDMMARAAPQKIHERLGDKATFPISGYKTTVAWDASALADFTFLSLLLIRGFHPSAAVEESIRLSPYLGDDVADGTVFQPLGLAIRPSPR